MESRHRAQTVKDAFLHAWDGYYKYAFPNDELHPVDNGFGNSRNGWGASAVDALSTALIMELPEVVDQIVDHIATIDYSKTNTTVSLFETTIRYLGGMLSGYDLLTGPLSCLASDVRYDSTPFVILGVFFTNPIIARESRSAPGAVGRSG